MGTMNTPVITPGRRQRATWLRTATSNAVIEVAAQLQSQVSQPSTLPERRKHGGKKRADSFLRPQTVVRDALAQPNPDDHPQLDAAQRR